MKNMNKKGMASSNHTFGKKDSKAGNSNSEKSKKHWDKLKSQGKCTRCANSTKGHKLPCFAQKLSCTQCKKPGQIRPACPDLPSSNSHKKKKSQKIRS